MRARLSQGRARCLSQRARPTGVDDDDDYDDDDSTINAFADLSLREPFGGLLQSIRKPFGLSCGPLGGASWTPLDASWAPLLIEEGALKSDPPLSEADKLLLVALLERSWAPLVGTLGAVLGASWGPS